VQFAGVRPTAFCQHALATAAPGRCNTLALRMADEATMNIDQIVIGKTYPGSVTSTTQYGAFVNIGCGQDGLVHVSELSDGYVANVNSVVNVGDSVQVHNLHTTPKYFIQTKCYGTICHITINSNNAGEREQVRVVKIEDAPGKAGRKKIGKNVCEFY
jgi:RecJ-like exonuclease